MSRLMFEGRLSNPVCIVRGVGGERSAVFGTGMIKDPTGKPQTKVRPQARRWAVAGNASSSYKDKTRQDRAEYYW